MRVREKVRVHRRVLAAARPYLYILPSFVFLVIFTHYPILKTFYLSLFRWNLATPTREFVVLANYVQVWSTPLFWQVLQNNVFFALGTTPVSLSLALGLALLINQKIRGLVIYRAVFQEVLDEKYTPEDGMRRAQAEMEKVLGPYQK